MSDQDDIIKTLIAEAYAEGPEGMRRVAETIINRAAVRGLTPAQVVRQKSQYTGYEHPGVEARRAIQSPTAQAAAQAAWDLALQPGDPTGGADHYLNPHVASPSWARKLPSTGTYGNHQFFASRPIPPAEIDQVVATALDTTSRRIPPTPASAATRDMALTGPQNTDPLLASFQRATVTTPPALQAALDAYVRPTQNAVTPAKRRPELPAMGIPDVAAIYKGIYPEAQPSPRTASVSKAVPQSLVDRGVPRVVATRGPTPQSSIDRGAARVTSDRSVRAPVSETLLGQGVLGKTFDGLTQDAGAEQALAMLADRAAKPTIRTAVAQSRIEPGAPRTQAPRQAAQQRAVPPALMAAMDRVQSKSAARVAQAVPQSLIDRGVTPSRPAAVAERVPMPRARPATPPADMISESMRRVAAANPAQLPPIRPASTPVPAQRQATAVQPGVGQPPATRVVQSVPFPPLVRAAEARPAPTQTFAGQDRGAPRVAASAIRTPALAGQVAMPAGARPSVIPSTTERVIPRVAAPRGGGSVMDDYAYNVRTNPVQTRQPYIPGPDGFETADKGMERLSPSVRDNGIPLYGTIDVARADIPPVLPPIPRAAIPRPRVAQVQPAQVRTANVAPIPHIRQNGVATQLNVVPKVAPIPRPRPNFGMGGVDIDPVAPPPVIPVMPNRMVATPQAKQNMLVDVLAQALGPLGALVGIPQAQAQAKRAAPIGAVLGRADNGGTITQGYGGPMNSLTQASDWWQVVTGQSDRSRGDGGAQSLSGTQN